MVISRWKTFWVVLKSGKIKVPNVTLFILYRELFILQYCHSALRGLRELTILENYLFSFENFYCNI